MIVIDAAVMCLSIALQLYSSVPSEHEIRQFLSNTDYRTKEWQTVFSSINDRFASKQQFSERLVGFLDDDDKNVRKGVLHVYVKLKVHDNRLIRPIVRVLREDDDVSIRAWAVEALHSIAGKNSLQHLLPALEDKNANVRAAAIRVFGKEPASAVQYISKLQNLLSDVDGYSYSISASLFSVRPIKYEAAVALGKIGPKADSCLPKLREIISNDSNSIVRVAAAVAVARIDKKDKQSVQYLVNEAEHASQQDIRSQAIQGLKCLGSRAKESVPILIKLLREDRSWLVRSNCVDALPIVNGFRNDTVGALIEATSDQEPWVQMAVLESLEKMGLHAENAIPAVNELLNKYAKLPADELPYLNGDIRVQAVATLLAIGKREEVVPIISRMLQKMKNKKLRMQIQELLGTEKGTEKERKRERKRGRNWGTEKGT